LGLGSHRGPLVRLAPLMRGLTALEAEVLALAASPPTIRVIADRDQRVAAEALVAAGRAYFVPAPEYGANARRLFPTAEGRVALMIHRFLRVEA
jgi:hypothetical protein